MAISAKRYEFLDQETNLATSDFFTADNKAILNSVNNQVVEISTALKEFMDAASEELDIKGIMKTIDEAKAEASGIVSDINKTIAEGTRAVNEAIAPMIDLANTVESEIDGFISDISNGITGLMDDVNGISDGLRSGILQASSMFSQLSTNCKKSGGYSGFGKPYNNKTSCNGRSRPVNKSACYGNSSSLAGILNKLSGGGFKAIFSDLNAVLKSVMALAGMGYDLNMCGVFAALAMAITSTTSNKTASNNVLSRASAGLIATFNAKGNTTAVLDISSASTGLHTILERPDIVRLTTVSFTLPNEVRAREVSNYGDRALAGLELQDSNWNISAYDGRLTTVNAIGSSSDFKRTMDARAKDANVYGPSKADVAPIDDVTMFNIALQVA